MSTTTTAALAPAVQADTYPWPYGGEVAIARTALLLVDWQTNFCGPGGYVDTNGLPLPGRD